MVAASRFREINEIIGTIHSLSSESDRLRNVSSEVTTFTLQNRLLFQLGLAPLEQGRWQDLARVLGDFDLERHVGQVYWFWLQVHALRKHEYTRNLVDAKERLESVIEKVRGWEQGTEERVMLAERIYRILEDKDRARGILKYVDQPDLVTDFITTESGLEPFIQRFRLNRLLYVWGDRRSPAEVIPMSDEPRHVGIVYVERAICQVAHISGRAWIGHNVGQSNIEIEILPLLRLFNHPWQETRRWTSWYALSTNSGEFYSMLVDAVAQHGTDAIEVLSAAFVRDWEDAETGIYWSATCRRQVIMALLRVGVPREWASGQLTKLEDMMFEQEDVSGSVEQALKQAESWLELENNDSARRCLRKLLHASFGVGVRKDYQLDQWIGWLGRINELEPEKAGERISKFAQAIAGLEIGATPEGMRSASEELLAITFRWSPKRGIQLFQWLIGLELIGHQSGVSITLREALGGMEPPTEVIWLALGDFLVPLATGANAEIMASLIERVGVTLGKETALSTGRYIKSKIAVYAFPSTRVHWNHGLANGLEKLGLDVHEVGLIPSDLRIEDDRDSLKLRLKRNDGIEEIGLEELKQRVSSVDDIRELLEQETEDSYFNWEPVVGQMIEGIEYRDLQELSELFEGKHRSAMILASISERLWNLSCSDSAWALGMKAVEASSPLGWSRWYDGGTRIAAFKSLVRVDARRAMPLVYKTLVRDLVTESWYPQNIALNLEDILELLTDDLNLLTLWAEIEQYTDSLLEGISTSGSQPLQFQEFIANDSPSRAIAELLAIHLDHPCFAVAKAAQRVCAKLLIGENLDMRDVLLEFLGKSEGYQERILTVLDAVSTQSPDALAVFQETIGGARQLIELVN